MICIPITAISNKEALHDIEHSCRIADAIELRMDLIADGTLPELISAARSSSNTVRIIVTWRKKEEAAQAGESLGVGGETKDQKDKKMAMLKQAIELGTDYIDIELSAGNEAIEELKSHCEKQGGSTKIIISYHNFKKTPSLTRLKGIFHQCHEFKPAVVKIVTYARKPEDNLQVLSLIPYARKHLQEIIALCMGDKGRISRMAAPSLGNFLDFAALPQKTKSAPGQLTISEMKQINKLVNDDERQQKPLVFSGEGSRLRNYVLLGNPVKQSLSPLMHNAALADLGIEGRYNAFCVYDLAAAVQGIRAMDIRGASVTIPFKSAVMEYLDDITLDALKLGAVNAIISSNGRLTGANTDWLGLVITLRQAAMTIKGEKFVIVGAGGTARAAAYGIIKEGGFPVIVNRTVENGKLLANQLNCPFYALSEIKTIKADCLINTTPVGMYPHIDKSPVNAAVLAGYKYVMDVIYNPLKTKMLKDAGQRGCHVLPGLDMFVHQGAEQIKLWTGLEPNRVLMKKVVEERLTRVE
jgi:shikimate dehydrogenase/3-dehydroquinate dehydratase type I